MGTALVTGSGAPTANLVYKLVARAHDATGELQPVAKRSVGKPSKGGRKWAVRSCDQAGIAEAEVVSLAPPAPSRSDRPLLHQLVRGGEVVGAEPLAKARERHQSVLAELPVHALQLSRGYPAIPTLFEPDGA